MVEGGTGLEMMGLVSRCQSIYGIMGREAVTHQGSPKHPTCHTRDHQKK